MTKPFQLVLHLTAIGKGRQKHDIENFCGLNQDQGKECQCYLVIVCFIYNAHLTWNSVDTSTQRPEDS